MNPSLASQPIAWLTQLGVVLGGAAFWPVFALGVGALPAGEVHCGLAVVGGGSGGFGAALAAARSGVDVVLIEQADSLGGTSVRAGVNCWEPGAGGTAIPFELYLRLKRIPGAVGIYSFGRHGSWFDPEREPWRYPGGETVIDPARRYVDTLERHVPEGTHPGEAHSRARWHGVVFEPEAMGHVMNRMLEETGRCRVLLRTACVAVETTGSGRVRAVRLADGRHVRARHYVDATGDAVVCRWAGCALRTGQEAAAEFGEPDAPAIRTSKLNGVSLIYRVTRAAAPAVEPLPEDVPAACWWRARFPSVHVNHYPNGDLNLNMLPTMEGEEFLRLGWERALAECRRRVAAHWHHLQSGYDEFRAFRVARVFPELGVRESARVTGECVLTQRDLLAGVNGQTHPDMICLADHSMDTHGGHRAGRGELRAPYGVPYRCLIPAGWRNLLVACRAASFSSIAASSCRLSRTMLQLGQAAGTAVGLALELGVDLPDVPPARLRAALAAARVQLEHPLPANLREHLERMDEDR